MSGEQVSLYVWTSQRFLALVVFTCRAFDDDPAVAFTRERFAMSELEHAGF